MTTKQATPKTRDEVVQYNLEVLNKDFYIEVSECSMDEDRVTSLYWYCFPSGMIGGMGYIQNQPEDIRQAIEDEEMYSISVVVNDENEILGIDFEDVPNKDLSWVKGCLEETRDRFNRGMK